MKNLIAKYRALFACALAILFVVGCTDPRDAGVKAAIAEAKAHPFASVKVKEAPPIPMFGLVQGKPIAWVYDPKLDTVSFVQFRMGATGDNPAGWLIDPTTGALVAPSGKVIAGVSFKQSPFVVSTTNIGTKSGLAQTVDGVALSSAGVRVWQLTVGTSDGCYVTGSSTWARCDEAASGADLAGAFFAAGHGTANKGVWIVTNAAGAGVAGTNTLTAVNLSTLSGGGTVASVFGRTGAVVAASSDYTLTQLASPTADFPMATRGLTGMRAGTTTGEGVTYEQVTDAIKSQVGGALGSNRAVEEFDRVVNTSGTGVIANGSLFGVLPWRAGFTGTGAAVSGVTTNQDTTHVGVLDLATGTTTTGIANITGSGVGIELLGSGMTAREDWIAQPSALSDGTNTYQTRFGYFDSTTAPTNGLYWEYVQGTSVNWRCIAMSASTPTVASGGSNVAVATTWQHLEWDWDGTNITCKVDGTSLGTIAGASLPSTPTALIAEITKSAGATNTHVYFDLYQRQRTYSPPKAN